MVQACLPWGRVAANRALFRALSRRNQEGLCHDKLFLRHFGIGVHGTDCIPCDMRLFQVSSRDGILGNVGAESHGGIRCRRPAGDAANEPVRGACADACLHAHQRVARIPARRVTHRAVAGGDDVFHTDKVVLAYMKF